MNHAKNHAQILTLTQKHLFSWLEKNFETFKNLKEAQKSLNLLNISITGNNLT